MNDHNCYDFMPNRMAYSLYMYCMLLLRQLKEKTLIVVTEKSTVTKKGTLQKLGMLKRERSERFYFLDSYVWGS